MSDLTHLDGGEASPEDDVFALTDGRTRSLVDFLYPTPAKRDTMSILGWWEKRRLPYNLIVGGAGALATLAFFFFATIPPLGAVPGLGLRILIPIGVFGVMANVCYTFGSLMEIFTVKIWGRDVLPVGPALFRIGLTFSVGLALLPALLIVIIWVARIVATVVG
ncbi:MAG: hypothetical protein HKN72_11355 [Gemmatimonadetes bacterium]|nr:hypothetical protein [Gemmatimonadota bacterium]NNF13815.1 hypothetical protein [Gemmatimonadota bacterium]NNL30428.1 hypothetical protein [Gemmatimonadota bacterium]